MKTTLPTAVSSPSSVRVRALVATVLVAALSLNAHGQPAKASQFYDEALKLYERNDLVATAVQLKNALQADQKLLAAHLLLGRVLMRLGQYKAAEASFEESLKQGVNKSEVALPLGEVYLKLGEHRKALDLVSTTGMPASLHVDILTLRGTAYAMMGNLTSAADSFSEARRMDPKSPGPWIAESPILLRAGERDKARAAAQKATELAPNNPLGWHQLGTVQQAIGDSKSALASYEKSIQLAPKHADSHVSKVTVLLSMGRTAEAEALLAQLKEWNVTEPRASFLRGSLAEAKGDTAAAKKEYADAVNMIDPMPPALRSGSEPLLMAGALSHRALGNREKAREYLDTLLARNSRNYAGQRLMASLLIEGQDFARALPILEGLLRAAPEDTDVLYMLGTAHMARKQYAKASEYMERAARGGQNNAALRELSISQLGMGQEKVAQANLEKAVARNPKDLKAGIELAVLYARQGQNAKAIKTAESLVKLDPENLAMLNFLGNVKGRTGDNKGMREAYQQALTKDPKFRQVVINLSWLDMDEGKFDAARQRLQAHLKDKADDAEVMFQLGLLEQRTRRPDEAKAWWTKADTLQPKDPRPALALIDQLMGQRQPTQALAAAKTLSSRFPELIPVQLTLSRVALATNEVALARQVLTDASKTAGFDTDSLVSIGRLQLQAANPDGAAHAASKALQATPDHLGALVLLVEVAGRRGSASGVDQAMATLRAKHPNQALTLLTAGHIAMSRRQFPQAAQNYRSAFEREPGSPAALSLSQAYLASGEADKAATVLESWGKKSPKDLVIQRALAEVQALTGKADAARKTYAAILAAEPDDPALLSSYALLLQGLNDPAALGYAEKAAKLAPDQAQFADTYGWLLVLKGDLDNGVRVLREARLRDPNNGLTRWHLASALVKSGRTAEARDELQAALASSMPPAPGPELSKLKAAVGL